MFVRISLRICAPDLVSASRKEAIWVKNVVFCIPLNIGAPDPTKGASRRTFNKRERGRERGEREREARGGRERERDTVLLHIFYGY